jgi:hypothetical protein
VRRRSVIAAGLAVLLFAPEYSAGQQSQAKWRLGRRFLQCRRALAHVFEMTLARHRLDEEVAHRPRPAHRPGLVTSFNGQLGGCSLSDTRIASHPDRLPRRSLLDSGRALGRRPRSGRPLQLGLFRICGCAQAVGETGVLGPTHLNPIRSRWLPKGGMPLSAAAWQLEAERTCHPQALRLAD